MTWKRGLSTTCVGCFACGSEGLCRQSALRFQCCQRLCIFSVRGGRSLLCASLWLLCDWCIQVVLTPKWHK
jgi:hypothetical protein